MPNSDFRYGVYDTTGKLHKGDLKGYGELAEQLDVRRVAFYLESGKEGVILGCRFIVQIIGGREERALFIARCPIDEIGLEAIATFYERAKEEIESLEEPRYKVLGLWKRGDIEDIEKVETPAGNIYELVIGKLIANEKLSVKTSDLFKGISLIAKVVQELKSMLHLGFKFAVSKSPFEADLLIRPEEAHADVDLDIGEGRIRYAEARRFEKFYQIYKDNIYRRGGEYSFKDRKGLADEIIRIAIRKYTGDICKLYQRDVNRLFQLCMGNSEDLIRVINQIVEDELAISGIEGGTAVDVIKGLALGVYGKGYEKVELFLLWLYKGIRTTYRKELQEFLIEKDIFWEEVVRDAVKQIAKEKDRELLHIFAGKSFADSKSAKRFAKGVRSAVDSLSREEALSSLKFVLDELEWESGEGGEILVKVLYDKLGYNDLTSLKDRYRQKLREFGFRLPAVEVEGIGERVKKVAKVSLMIFVVFLIVFSAGMWVGGHYEPFRKIPYLTYLLSPNISNTTLDYALISDEPLNITTSVMLENKGNVVEDYTVKLNINNEIVDCGSGTIEPNTNKNVSCEYTLLKDGEQNIGELKPVKMDWEPPQSANISYNNPMFRLKAVAPLKLRASSIIENKGNIAGGYDARIRNSNGFVYRNGGTLNANENTTIGFEYILLEADEYDMREIDGLLARINELKSCKVEVTTYSSSEG